MDFFKYKNGELFCEDVPAEKIAREVGFTEFLPKPFRLDDLTCLFDQYLREETERAAPDTDLYEDGVLQNTLALRKDIVRAPAERISPPFRKSCTEG
jgi:hypothetical protein